MSLVDEYAEWSAASSKVRNMRSDSSSDEDYGDGGPTQSPSGTRVRRSRSRDFREKSPALADEDPMFVLKKLRLQPARHHGEIVSVSVGASVVLMGTQSCAIIRATRIGANEEDDQLEEMQIPKKSPDDAIRKVFIDPLGIHGLVSMKSGAVYYLHEKKTRHLACSKIKGHLIESVAWDLENVSDESTQPFLIGTSQGLIFEVLIDKFKDRLFAQRYSLNDMTERKGSVTPVCGLKMERFPAAKDTEAVKEGDKKKGKSGKDTVMTKLFVMAATPTRHYQFVAPGSGANTLESLFAHYAHGTPPRFNELPSDLPYGELRFFYKDFEKMPPQAYSLLSGAGVYHGKLDFSSSSVVGDGQLLPFPKSLGQPKSIMLSEFHHFLLSANQLLAVSRLNEKQVWSCSEFLPEETMKQLVYDVDSSALYAYSDKHVYEIKISREDRNVWKLYLEQKQFDLAMEHASEQEQQEILTQQADYYYAERKYKLAAATYARTDRSFEEVTLKFVSTGSSAALKTYLLSKLDNLKVEDLTQSAMLSTWLTEIFLDHLNTLQGVTSGNDDLKEFFGNTLMPKYPAESGASSAQREKEYEEEVTAFHQFLSYYGDCLNKETTFDLIASHGRMEDLLFFAKETNDTEWVLNYYIQNEQYGKVLELLRAADTPELYYKFCPVVLPHAPKQTVDTLIKAQGLDPSQLIPALMRYESLQQSKRQAQEFKDQQASKQTQAAGNVRASSRARIRDDQVIRYLDHCVRKGNSDPALHNYLISLYAAAEDEVPLLRFIEQQKSNPHFDTNYSLRLCHSRKKYKACVATYTAMKRFEDAVKLALSVDVNLAKAVLTEALPHTEETERKRLWLLVAKQLLKEDQKGGVQRAMDLLKESELRLQDILPLKEFPDFEQIGAFKEEICKSLNTYNEEIVKLRNKMEEFTSSADELRKDIGKLRERSGLVTSNQKCDLCSQPVLIRQFCLFPCSHVFHGDCMVEKVRDYLDAYPAALQELHERKRFQEKRERKLSPELSSQSRREQLIQEFASSQCYFCGDIMIHSVMEPFIKLPEEEADMDSWAIAF
eukprot:gb/GEZN01001036.1/.p1 GENE.gb/GEZN01001036.1/~~gb/GEZN01001036.1/.p1  ORF type:complete len:1060 (+),score=217.53 gb/GEZN01001036.1/:55-3234(+)